MIPQPDAVGFVLVAECPDPDQARALPDAHGWPYRGIWHAPPPADAAVHLFAEPTVYPDTMLRETGWRHSLGCSLHGGWAQATTGGWIDCSPIVCGHPAPRTIAAGAGAELEDDA